jgi:hypothetical protein
MQKTHILQVIFSQMIIEKLPSFLFKYIVYYYNCVRHPLGHRPKRDPLRWVCSSYLRQKWNVVLASSLQRVEKNSR